MNWLRFLILAFALLAGITVAEVSAQDETPNTPDEVQSDTPTIDEPEVGIETPDSKLPEDLEASPLPQWWQGVGGVVSAGLTAFFLRWLSSAWLAKHSPPRQTDIKRGFALLASVIVGLVGAWLADTLAWDKVTLSGIFYTAAAGWLTREVIPGAKGLTHHIENSPNTR